MTRVLALGWFLLGALVAVPACDLTTSMADVDVLCIVAAIWFAMALVAYALVEADKG